MKNYKAAVHVTQTKKGYPYCSVAYGKNPFGKLGGTCGNVENAEWITEEYAGRPNWMYKLVEELNKLQLNPNNVKINHDYGTSTYEIVTV